MNAIIDDSPNSVRFRLGSDYNGVSWNRTLITPTPDKILHIKIELFNCENYISELEFLDLQNVSVVDLYTETPSINPANAPYLAYNTPNYVQPNTFYLCPVIHIDDFSPKIISAGTDSILTIIGRGFGCKKGNGEVLFKNTTDGGASYVEYLNDIDYISWTDSEIKIKIPHHVNVFDTLYYPGSGYFIVFNNSNTAITSSDILEIPFSVINYYTIDPNIGMPINEKIPYRQISFDNYTSNHAREFSLDTSISNNPIMSAIVYKALKDWSCKTNINWIIVDTVAKDTVTGIKSIIYLDNNLPNDKLGVTQPSNLGYCTDITTNKNFIYVQSINIGLKRDAIWFYDTTMTLPIPPNSTDFYNVILHELGHAHYLGHVNDVSDLMYYASKSAYANPIPASNRLHINTSPNQVSGGIYILDNSYNLNFACNIIHLSVASNPENCGTLGVGTINQNSSDFKVYPNPFNNSISIQFTLKKPMSINCQVKDITGKSIYFEDFTNVNIGSNNKTINLEGLSSGIYLITVKMGNDGTKTIKVIKE